MAHRQFVVSDTNPNDTHGGGGCVCDPLKQTDCKPPYVVFIDTYMEDPRSPMVVLCQTCANAAADACLGEALSVGEKGGAVAVDAESWDEDEDLPEV